jgi:hypothetical protein
MTRRGCVARKRIGLVCLLSLAGLSPSGLPQAGAAQQQQASIEDITAAWRESRKQAATFVVTWNATELRKATTIGLESDDYTEEVVNSGETRTIAARLRCLFDDAGHIRLEEKSQQWSPEQASYVPVERVSAFWGGRATHFLPTSNLGYPNATLQECGRADVARHMLVAPLRLVLRTVDAEVGVFHPSTPLKLGGRAVIGGRECIVVRGAQPLSSFVEIAVYADVTRDFLPVRYESSVSGKLLQTAEITDWDQTSEGLWIPTEWEAVRVYETSGEPAWVDRAKVESFEVNVRLTERDFSVPLPVGTLVSDTAAQEQYIIKEGNRKRRFSDEEFSSSSYEQLLGTEEGELSIGGNTAIRGGGWMLWGNVILLAVLAAWLGLKWLKA